MIRFEATQETKKALEANPEIINKWVTALRSGSYKQCKGTLADPHGQGMAYCCLGVLESSVGNVEDILLCGEEVPSCLEDCVLLDGKIPCPENLLFTALNSDSGSVTYTKPYGLNDDYNLTFPEIADLLEGKVLRKDDINED